MLQCLPGFGLARNGVSDTRARVGLDAPQRLHGRRFAAYAPAQPLSTYAATLRKVRNGLGPAMAGRMTPRHRRPRFSQNQDGDEPRCESWGCRAARRAASESPRVHGRTVTMAAVRLPIRGLTKFLVLAIWNALLKLQGNAPPRSIAWNKLGGTGFF